MSLLLLLGRKGVSVSAPGVARAAKWGGIAHDDHLTPLSSQAARGAAWGGTAHDLAGTNLTPEDSLHAARDPAWGGTGAP